MTNVGRTEFNYNKLTMSHFCRFVRKETMMKTGFLSMSRMVSKIKNGLGLLSAVLFVFGVLSQQAAAQTRTVILNGKPVTVRLAPTVQPGVLFNKVGSSIPNQVQSVTPSAVQKGSSPQTGKEIKKFPTFEENRKKLIDKMRFDALKKIKFDRRSSMVLRAWAELRAVEAKVADPKAKSKSAPEKQDGSSKWIAKTDVPPLPSTKRQSEEMERQWLLDQTKRIANQTSQFDVWLKMGHWEKAGKYFRTFTKAQQKQIYAKMVTEYSTVDKKFQSLDQAVAQTASGSQRNRQYMERHQFDVNDFEGLMKLAPEPLNIGQVRQMAQILSSDQSFVGTVLDLKTLLKKVVSKTPNADHVKVSMGDGFKKVVEKQIATKDKKDKKEKQRPLAAWLTKRQAAFLLFYSGNASDAEEFIPNPKFCLENGDAEGLNLLSTIYLSRQNENERKQKDEFLKKAWDTVQVILSVENISIKQKNEALIRAISLAPKMDKEVRQKWLKEKFGTMDRSAKELLAVVGERASRGLQVSMHDQNSRSEILKIMKTATEAMLRNQKGGDVRQRALLTMLAKIWVKEAEVTKVHDRSESLGTQMRRDNYGNFYYSSYDYDFNRRYRGSGYISAIPTKVILETLPEGKWFELINPAVKPKVSKLCAGLLLKVKEEERAFPYIESLNQTDKKAAQELAEEFLRVWTTNHDLNSQRNGGRYNPYYFSYGFNQAAQSIPLTRSKQERNLKELTSWVKRLRKLEGIEVDQDILANAFTTCHSSAEVYRFEEIETVFGEMKDIKPDVLAALTERMRVNLKGLWRKPDVQKKAKTKRKKPQIQQQVVDGYQIALTTLAKAIQDHPDNWRIASVMACMLYDQNEYHSVVIGRKQYSEKRTAAYQLFAHSANLYAKWVKDQPEEKWTAKPYELWFNAMLGSPDLPKVNSKKIAAIEQTLMIKNAIFGLGGKLTEEHMKRFATTMVTSVTRADPSVKFTYLTEGFRITGMREEVIEAKKLYEYYQDLVTELELETSIDGSDEISSTQDFGIFVRINHTPEIERESGGFGRFLQNQNAMMYGYNYGRNTEDYRDKFEETARVALSEDFEVKSVTFQSDKVKSQVLNGRTGWRYTPYAYIVLRARGTEVDRIPSIRIDMDFLDTTGYVVLPVRSHEIPVKCAAKASEPRPFKNLEVTQTLDQREGSNGKLTLQIKAKSNGLVPNLEDILSLDPADFEIVSNDDSRANVNGFDQEKETPEILSERIWEIELKGKSDLSKKPDTFQFAKAKGEAKMSLMSFQDEDVKEVSEVVTLKGDYGEAAFPWMPVIGGSSVLGIGLLLGLALFLGGGKKEKTGDNTESVQLETFQILGLLEQRLNDPSLQDEHRKELQDSVRKLEAEHFSSAANGSANHSDPLDLAKKWL